MEKIRVTEQSVQELFTISNLRMKNGQWFIDVTNLSDQKTETKTIGNTFSLNKLSEAIPQAVFNKKIKEHLTKNLSGVTYAKLTVKVSAIDRSKFYARSILPVNDTRGNLLVSIETGNSLEDDIRKAESR